MALLAAIYAGVLFLFLHVIFRTAKLDLKKLKFSSLFRAVAVLLFVFMFTYYGDHGLGDDSRIPLGHGKAIEASDGYPYFKPDKQQGELHIGNFSVAGDNFCAEADSGFIFYNLKSNQMINFKGESGYSSFAQKHKLPLPTEFEDFYTHYNRYWGGWRFWLLP
ncbi:hypothetical protein BC343_28425 [Mucilaginibacter pedocola]|uniref:Uncharacterized protein n=2 Tax=Mucilaginibacter pedocola TaxID=1792845 RepID=A0A1S9PE76_9SPHI|nr:hypothetical protein BC343_28425 [Mucilaginibacter pedocola]